MNQELIDKIEEVIHSKKTLRKWDYVRLLQQVRKAIKLNEMMTRKLLLIEVGLEQKIKKL